MQLKNVNLSSATKLLLVLLAVLIFVSVVMLLPVAPDTAEAAALKQGSSGATVKTMQTKLISWGYLSGTADGVFGAKTKAAVIAFHKANGLTADGVVGTRTAQAMGISISGASTTAANTSSGTALKQGSSGTVVKTMQTKLINWGYLKGTADGVFGAKTKAAVIAFQKANGLTADGVVGAKTAQVMGITLSGSSSTTGNNSTSSTDLNLLARVIYGEARGEPYTGQVAVAAVVLNRVKSSSFPNSIAGVIYQSGAFDCVADGQINMTPNDSAYKAARDALNGWDPTYGCLFYYNPKTATSKWMLSRTIKLNIGNHAFC